MVDTLVNIFPFLLEFTPIPSPTCPYSTGDFKISTEYIGAKNCLPQYRALELRSLTTEFKSSVAKYDMLRWSAVHNSSDKFDFHCLFPLFVVE